MVLISVIMIIYNGEKYLEEAIESVLNEKNINLELLLINDGSNDNSKSICEYYKSLDSRIKLIEQENQGPSEARLTGIANCSGDYIIFLDQDDVLPKNVLTILSHYLKYGAEVTSGKVLYLENIDAFKDNQEIKDYKFEIYKNSVLCKDMKLRKSSGYPTMWGAKLYKKEFLNNFIKNIDLKHYRAVAPFACFEDVLVAPMLIDYAKKVIVVDCISYLHRENKKSLTRSGKLSQFYFDHIETGKILLDYYKSKNYKNAYRRQIYNYMNSILRIRTLLYVNSNLCIDRKVKYENKIDYYYKNIYLEFLLYASNNKRKLIYLLYFVNKKIWLKLANKYYC